MRTDDFRTVGRNADLSVPLSASVFWPGHCAKHRYKSAMGVLAVAQRVVERNVEISPIDSEQHAIGLNFDHAGLGRRVDAAVMTGIGQNSLGMIVIHVSTDACTHLRSEGVGRHSSCNGAQRI